MDEDFDIDPVAARAPQSWIEALERSRADVKAGRVVDSAVVLRRLDESVARMQAKCDVRDDLAEVAAEQ